MEGCAIGGASVNVSASVSASVNASVGVSASANESGDDFLLFGNEQWLYHHGTGVTT